MSWVQYEKNVNNFDSLHKIYAEKKCLSSFKGSSGEDEDPTDVENSDDDLKKYSYTDGSIKFSYRVSFNNISL